MDRSKNRTDMLAAGRKKLQQFREKKGGGNPAKSSTSLVKPAIENENEEPSNSSQATPAPAVDLANVIQPATSASGAGERAEELRLELKQLPSHLDIQEAQGAVLMNDVSSVLGHDLNATSHSGVSPEVVEKHNGGAYQIGEEAIGVEISSALHNPIRVQTANGSSLVDDRDQGSGLNLSLSVKMEKDTYPIQNLKRPASSQMTYPLVPYSHGVPVVSGIGSERISSNIQKVDDQEQQVFEDKLKVITDPAVHLSPPEEFEDVGLGISHKFKEDTCLEEKNVRTPLSQDITVNDIVLRLEPGERASGGGIEYNPPAEALHLKDECHGKDGLSSLQTNKMMGFSVGAQFVPDGMLMDGNTAFELDKVKTHLYLSSIAKDILQHLDEQTQLYEHLHSHSSHEVHRLNYLVKKAGDSKEVVTKELVQCMCELQLLSVVKDEIESNYLLLRREIEQEHIKCCNLKRELQNSQEGSLYFSKELANCRHSLDALQKENSSLLESLISETDARKQLVEEVDVLSTDQMNLTTLLTSKIGAAKKMAEERALLSNENMVLMTELKAKEETLHSTLEKNVKLQDSLRELGSCFEQLIEENICLSCSLDIYNAKIKEIGRWMLESTCYGQEGQISDEDLSNCTADISRSFYEGFNVDACSSIKMRSNSIYQQKVYLLPKVDGKDSDSYTLSKVLVEQLQQAKIKLQDLEKSIQGMHSHSLSLNGSGGIATTTGVSKLIKAFESKANHIGFCANEVPSTVGERPEDLYTISVEQISSLSNILNRMELEMGKVRIHVMDNQHNWEALKKSNMDCGSQKHQTNSFQIASDVLAKKVVNFEHQIHQMLNHLDELDQLFSKEASGFLNEIELLKGEVAEDLFILKQERDITVGMILEAVGKVDASTELKVLEVLDTRSHFMNSVNTAILSIEKVHSKFEETSQNYNTLHHSHEELNRSFMDIQGKHSLAMELFHKFCSNLVELINEAQQDAGDTALNSNFDEVPGPLPEKCEMVANYLWKLLSERVYLFSRIDGLNMDLSIRNQEIEELTIQLKELEVQKNIRDGLESTFLIKTKEIEEVKQRCLLLENQLKNHDSCKDSYALARSCEIGSVEYGSDVVDSCNSVLSRLEELVAFHLRNYEKIVDEIMLSQKYLQDANMLMEASSVDCSIRLPTLLSQVAIPKMIELHEQLKLLTISNDESKTEIQIFKEDMIKMEETLEASNHELQLKASEVEQLEQKLSSVREKLSIAVAKGKSLIVQRDGLKQALMEKNSELDKATQELQLKESLLDGFVEKLKSCSEVERIEALESELLYIRNSAAALRDSFLQKDSVLQRIEEVLEDLDLSDDFHHKDILEKIELLSRFAIDHPSSIANVLEQKSLDQRTDSEARESAVLEANKNYFLLGSNLDFDELKRKHAELQGKFCQLTEHNDMLEQSLLERNNLLQKWEEVLGRIDLPSHMLTMEAEDKVEWLVKELSDLKQERDSLQFKIDNLEISSDMLIVDIEESHKKISELTAEVIADKTEKEFFTESLEKLRVECFVLSEKAVRDEQDRENLLKELDDLQDKLIGNDQFEYFRGMEDKMHKLYDLVSSTLTESDKVDFLSGGTLAENLEESLKKLIDRYIDHLNKPCFRVPDNEVLFNESIPHHGKMMPEEALFGEGSDMATMRLELDCACNKLASMEEDRDANFGKYELLRLEVDNLKMQIQLLDAEKNEDLEKCKSLMLELDVMGKQRDSLQAQLTQEEQKSACFKEKLNLAVRKGRGLVQQRDSLKQTVDEMNASMEQLKINYSQETEALKSEKSLLTNQLSEMELNLKHRKEDYSRLLNAVNAIDLEGEDNESDPVQKLRIVSNIILDIRSQATAAELEANKSKLAAERLLAELNEVQERNDILKEELGNMEASIAEYSTQRDDSVASLEHFMSVHSAEKARLANSLMDFMSDTDQLRRSLLWFSRILAEVLRKNVDIFSYVEDLKELSFEGFCSPDRNCRHPSNILLPNDPKDEEISRPSFDIGKYNMHQHLDETLLFEHFALAGQSLHQCMCQCDELKEHICKHSEFLDKKVEHLSESIDAVKRKKSALKDTSESLNRDITHLESNLKDKDAKISSLYRNLTVLYEACSTSILESSRRKSQIMGNSPTLGEDFGNLCILKLPSYANLEQDGVHSINDLIKMMTESIVSTMKNASYKNELAERAEKDLKDTVLELRRELQEKDIQMNKDCEELVLQIRDAEAVAKRSMSDLNSSRARVIHLEKKAEVMEADRKLIDLRLNELQDVEALSKQLQERINSLEDTLIAKDQEIKALIQALDEEEAQIEYLQRNNKDMDNLVQKKTMQLETLEASHIKTMSKLSTTIRKFDELHNLSESLLAEIEVLQSQLQQQDSEISFLRHEVTRSTNNVLASQETCRKHSSEVHELLTWMNAVVSHIGGPPLQFDDQESNPVGFYIDIMDKKIASVIAELEELRAAVQCKDALLETERSRVQELLTKAEDIKISLPGNERLERFSVGRAPGQQSSSNSLGTSEIEQVVQRNKISSDPIATYTRSGRKVKNDQIAISIDTETDGVLEDEDDDKSHGFKTLTMSPLVPRAARPIVDRIDGIWVSAERLLMRQPTLRLGFLMYWIALHALLVSFV